MQIHFKGTNYDLAPEMTAHTRKKLHSVRRYLGKGKHAAFAYVDLGKETEAHQNGRIWSADINLECDGHRFYAKAVEESLENAIDKAVSEIKASVLSYRKKQQSLIKRSGSFFKAFLRGT